MKPTERSIVSNVLVIGTGGAGLRAATAAHDAGCEVVLVGKRSKGDAHSVLAAGGINAAIGSVDREDTPQQHFADTMREGYFLADERAVELLVEEAPQRVVELMEWGCPFALTADGQLDQRFFGAHTYRRTCYAGDFTGRAIMRTLGRQITRRQIRVLESLYVSDLLVHEGSCFGAYAFDLNTGDRIVLLADAVVLAAGGHTRIWRRSSSRRDENNGEGMALALRAGCALVDMELVQFHPTGMVEPETIAGTLVTEAVRGEGGRLFNSLGERFMERYDPERMELSTRDRVALANYREIIEGRAGPNGGVLLDISHRPKEFILERLPRMYRQFLEYQMRDISESPMEVAPTAHYSMGGVRVDAETHATEIDGLFAAGEVTSGVHGANRLGGNSLAEVLVFGKRAGDAAAKHSQCAEGQLRHRLTIRAARERVASRIRPGSEMARPLQRALRDLMWENCGVVRSEQSLVSGLNSLTSLAEASREVDVRPSSEGFQDLGMALDLECALLTADATMRTALARRESRGAHQRSDWPETDESYLANFTCRLDGKHRDMSVTQECIEMSPVVDALRADAEQELTLEGRLLE